MISELRLTQLGRVAELAPCPDESWLAVSVARLDTHDSAYVHDLWRVPVDGGEATRITSGPFNDRRPRFDGDCLYFLSNRPVDGGEPEKRSQVWMFGPHQGDPVRVTDEPLGVMAFEVAAGTLALISPMRLGVAHDQQREVDEKRKKHGPSALRYTQRPVRFWDHWEPEAAPHLVVVRDGVRQDLTPDYDAELRPESDLKLDAAGQRVLVTAHANDASDGVRSSWLRVFDVQTGAFEDFGADERAWYGGAQFCAAGIVATRAERSEEHAHTHELVVFEGQTMRVVAADWDRRPVPSAMLDDTRCLVTFHDRGEVRAATVDLTTGNRVENEAPGSHALGSLKPFRDGYVGIGHALEQPPRPYIVNKDGRAWLPELSGMTGVEQDSFVEERFDVKSTDGVPIDTRLIKPRGSGPFPTVLWIHGGPINHFGNQWHWRWNPLVLLRAGYAIALPNARGSTGYGYEFIDGIWGNVWGEQCYADLMAVTDVLEQREDVGALAAMGGSFGGYMVNWIGGMTDRFAALVSHAGLFDLRAFYGATDAGPYFGLHNASTPWSGDIDKCSPHVNVSKWKTPTLVLHGEKDYRVPIGEALALFEALQAHDVESELIVYPDENHWILKPRNIRHWYGSVVDFLDRKMGT